MSGSTDAETSTTAQELHLDDQEGGELEWESPTAKALRLSSNIEDYETRSPNAALSDAIEANMIHIAEHQVETRGAKFRLEDL